MIDTGTPHTVVAEIMGWSTSSAVRMIKEVYGHVSLETKRKAIEQREAAQGVLGYTQFPTQSTEKENVTIQ